MVTRTDRWLVLLTKESYDEGSIYFFHDRLRTWLAHIAETHFLQMVVPDTDVPLSYSEILTLPIYYRITRTDRTTSGILILCGEAGALTAMEKPVVHSLRDLDAPVFVMDTLDYCVFESGRDPRYCTRHTTDSTWCHAKQADIYKALQ